MFENSNKTLIQNLSKVCSKMQLHSCLKWVYYFSIVIYRRGNIEVTKPIFLQCVKLKAWPHKQFHIPLLQISVYFTKKTFEFKFFSWNHAFDHKILNWKTNKSLIWIFNEFSKRKRGFVSSKFPRRYNTTGHLWYYMFEPQHTEVILLPRAFE